MEEDQVDPGLITVTLSPSGFGGFPGLPPGLVLPEGFLPPGAGEIPGDFPLPEGFPPVDGLPLPEDVEPPEPVEVELILDGFIVTGSRDTTVTIKGEDMDDGMMPAEPEQPMEPAEPVEQE